MLDVGIVYQDVEVIEFFFGCGDYVGNFVCFEYVGVVVMYFDIMMGCDFCLQCFDFVGIIQFVEDEMCIIFGQCFSYSCVNFVG